MCRSSKNTLTGLTPGQTRNILYLRCGWHGCVENEHPSEDILSGEAAKVRVKLLFDSAWINAARSKFHVSIKTRLLSWWRTCYKLVINKKNSLTLSFVLLYQCFPNCGPRTPGGPWGFDRGSAGKWGNYCFLVEFIKMCKFFILSLLKVADLGL